MLIYPLKSIMYIIYRLKFDKLKVLKAKFFINRVDFFNLEDKLFSIIALQLILFFLVKHYMYLFFVIVKSF